jgi:hypothetical protein
MKFTKEFREKHGLDHTWDIEILSRSYSVFDDEGFENDIEKGEYPCDAVDNHTDDVIIENGMIVIAYRKKERRAFVVMGDDKSSIWEHDDARS